MILMLVVPAKFFFLHHFKRPMKEKG